MMRSMLIVMAGDFLVRALAGVAGLMLVRYMDKSDFAVYVVLAGTAGAIAGSLSGAFGTLYIVRHDELSLRTRKSEYLWAQLILAVGIGLAFVFFREYFHQLGWAAGLLLITSVMSEYARNVERQKLRFLWFSIFNMARGLTFFGFVALLVFWLPNYLNERDVALAQIAAAAIASLPLVKVFKWPHFPEIKKIYNAILGKDLLLFGYVFLVGAISQLDIVYLRWWSDEQQIAAFGSAFRYYALLIALFGAADKVVQPHLARAKTKDEMREIFLRVKYFLMFCIPIVAIVCAAAPWVLPLIDRGKFPESIRTFQVLCVSASLSLILSPYSSILYVHRRFGFLLGGAAMGLTMNALLSYLLIPRFGALGSAISILCVGGLLNFSFFTGARRILRKD